MIGGRGIPSTYSGVEVFMKEICPRLVNKGHEVTVFCQADNFEMDNYKGVNLIMVPALRSKRLGTMTHSFMSSVYCLFAHIEIWHFNAIGPASLAWIPKIKRCPSVATIHSLNWKHSKWNEWEKKAIKAIEIVAAKFPDVLVAVSKQYQKYFRDKYGRHIAFVPNGVNIKQPVPPDKILKYGLGFDPFILFVGRLSPEKGLHYLIDAYKGLETDHKLVIAGGFTDSNDYFRYLKSNSDERVLFLGHLSTEVLSELYSSASVFVLPSESEGLSISLLEAMSYGCCVVTSDIPENMDVIKNCGVPFDFGNIQSLKDALKWLTNTPEIRRELGEKALKRVAKLYKWDDICFQYEEIYENIIEKHAYKNKCL